MLGLGAVEKVDVLKEFAVLFLKFLELFRFSAGFLHHDPPTGPVEEFSQFVDPVGSRYGVVVVSLHLVEQNVIPGLFECERFEVLFDLVVLVSGEFLAGVPKELVNVLLEIVAEDHEGGEGGNVEVADH